MLNYIRKHEIYANQEQVDVYEEVEAEAENDDSAAASAKNDKEANVDFEMRDVSTWGNFDSARFLEREIAKAYISKLAPELERAERHDNAGTLTGKSGETDTDKHVSRFTVGCSDTSGSTGVINSAANGDVMSPTMPSSTNRFVVKSSQGVDDSLDMDLSGVAGAVSERTGSKDEQFVPFWSLNHRAANSPGHAVNIDKCTATWNYGKAYIPNSGRGIEFGKRGWKPSTGKPIEIPIDIEEIKVKARSAINMIGDVKLGMLEMYNVCTSVITAHRTHSLLCSECWCTCS